MNDIDLSGSQTPAHRLGGGAQPPLWLQLLWGLEDHLLAIRTGCPGSLSLCPLLPPPHPLAPSLLASQALSLHPALGVMSMAQGTWLIWVIWNRAYVGALSQGKGRQGPGP